MPKSQIVKVTEIKEGDKLDAKGTSWEAIEDAELLGSGEVSVRVMYVDGGIGDRIWDDREIEIPVLR